MSTTPTAVLFSGGYNHPFAETSPVLASFARAEGWTVAIETDLNAALAALGSSRLLIVNALCWSMTQHEKYAPDREIWAREMNDDQIAALDAFVCEGGSLLVMHTGTICWDTQPGWRRIMGGGWQWGLSQHPPLGPAMVAMTAAGLAFCRGAEDFSIVDEVYHNLGPQTDCDVLATCEISEGPQPIAWMRRHGQGRVCVDALGHDANALLTPGHSLLIRSMLQWLQEGASHARD